MDVDGDEVLSLAEFLAAFPEAASSFRVEVKHATMFTQAFGSDGIAQGIGFGSDKAVPQTDPRSEHRWRCARDVVQNEVRATSWNAGHRSINSGPNSSETRPKAVVQMLGNFGPN